MTNNIDLKKVRKDAEDFHSGGGFYCSEAIVASVRQNLAPEMPAGLIAAASGFGAGVGRARCICGAITGGIICLGYFFGRTEPANPSSPECQKSQKTLRLANELHESFRKNHKGVACCRVQTKDFKWGSAEHMSQCMSYAGEMAAKVAEIIVRELKNTDA
jgi:C_GCAxxG_C_C family probable redox protein